MDKELQRLVERTEKLYQRNIKTGYADSAFYDSARVKIKTITGTNTRGLNTIVSKAYKRLNKTKQQLLKTELNRVLNSKLNTKTGLKNANRKRVNTFVEKGLLTETEGRRFNRFMGNKTIGKIVNDYGFLTYSQVMNFATRKVSMKKILDSIDATTKKYGVDITDKDFVFDDPLEEDRFKQELLGMIL